MADFNFVKSIAPLYCQSVEQCIKAPKIPTSVNPEEKAKIHATKMALDANQHG
jgi:hypothetical protein